MKVTMNDMEDPQFWLLERRARKQVHDVLADGFLGQMNDREAKAVDDAVGALTKVLLMQARAAVNA